MKLHYSIYNSRNFHIVLDLTLPEGSVGIYNSRNFHIVLDKEAIMKMAKSTIVEIFILS